MQNKIRRSKRSVWAGYPLISIKIWIKWKQSPTTFKTLRIDPIFKSGIFHLAKIVNTTMLINNTYMGFDVKLHFFIFLNRKLFSSETNMELTRSLSMKIAVHKFILISINVLYDCRESCLLNSQISFCLHKSLCLPKHWSKLAYRLI